MGINMDIRNEPKYSFLDLHDLDEADKNAIAEILRLDTNLASLKLPWDIGEKEYEVTSEIMENVIEDATNQWQQYAIPEGGMATTFEMPSTPMMAATMAPGHPFASHPQMIYAVGDFPGMGNPFGSSAAGDPNAYPYMPRFQFGPPTAMYSSNQADLMGQPSGRENERRGSRNRVGKRGDSYNRQMSANSEMQPGYIVQGQPQYNPMMPMSHTSCGLYQVSPQSHPAAGPPIFLQPSSNSPFPQAPQIHHNNHPPYHQSSYPSHTNPTKYVRNSVSQTIYYNQEGPKNLHKHHDKRGNPEIPPFRHSSLASNNNNNSSSSNNNNNEEMDSPKRNYSKTIFVSNSNANVESNSIPAAKQLVDNKKPSVNHVKPEVPEVSRVTEESEEKRGEKKDIPVVPVSSENNNTMTIVKTEKPVPVEKEVSVVREEKVVKVQSDGAPSVTKVAENANEQAEITAVPVKTVQDVPKSAESSPTAIATVLPSTSVSCAPATPSVSWAHVLKKGPSCDAKSPPPITKLPICLPSINLPSASAELVIPKAAATPEVPARNENVSVTPSRSSTEATPTKNAESTAWPEIKTTSETTPQNNLNDPAVFRMGELLLKYEMEKQTVSLMPRGLTNRSNYCYINSILQALLACPPFYNLLMALPHPRNSMTNSPTPLIDNMVRFVREFNPLSEGARMPRKDKSQKRGEDTAVDVQYGVAFEPSYVYTMLKNTSCAGGFSVEGRQEDAEEFLSCLLNGISDEMLELMKLVNSETSDAASNPTESLVNFSNAEEGWKVMGPKNKGSITRCTEFARTPLSDIFRGQLRSRVLRTGDESTDNVQPFFTLQLDIEKAESVEEALEILVGKDQVEGMTCSKTKQQIQAWKQVLLEELPIILILHLKWFDYKLDGCSKIFKRVGFPVDLKLDGKLLSPNVVKKLHRKQRQYKLFAVTYHDGKEATKGHYVTDAFHVGYNAWVRYDDSSVKGINENDVLNPSPPRVPYLLYYRRLDTIGNNQLNTTRAR